MSLAARPLAFLIVSPDSGLLHELSWVLTAVGYGVVTSKDLEASAAWRHVQETDFVLFDGRSIAKPTPTTLAQHANHPTYRMFLYDPAVTVDLASWFAAGANDGLAVPVSRGELLSRIRAGAKILEFDNRRRSQSARHRLPGIHSRRGFLHHLSKYRAEEKSADANDTLLTIAVDLFAGFCREAGEAATRHLLSAVATSIQQCVNAGALATYNDDGAFHVFLPNQPVAEAKVIAEHIAQKFQEAQGDRDRGPRLSVSTSVVPWEAGLLAERLLEQGHATLLIAEQSGGDCIIERDEFATELSSWQNELTTGNLFSNTIAQDIMEPFAALLERDSPNTAMLTALRHGRSPMWPFVDPEGRLVGVASPGLEIDSVAARELTTGGSPALTNPRTIAHNATLNELHEVFSTESCQTLVVVADSRPLGYITRGGFLSLFEPISLANSPSDESGLEDSRDCSAACVSASAN